MTGEVLPSVKRDVTLPAEGKGKCNSCGIDDMPPMADDIQPLRG